MSHHQQHQEEEEKSYAYLYYVIGLVFGLITGFVIEKDFIWVPIGGVLGLLTAAFFANVVSKSSEKG
jgi:ABC-type iron transport system FetAB permease component